MKRAKGSAARGRGGRSLFAELREGVEALAGERSGKLTLRASQVEVRAAPRLSAREIVALREALQVSRAVFAACLRTNVRTLENWEQGRARPNAQAALLIHLVRAYPDTVQRLAEL